MKRMNGLPSSAQSPPSHTTLPLFGDLERSDVFFLLFFHYLSYTFFQKIRNTIMINPIKSLIVNMKRIKYNIFKNEKVFNTSTQCEVSV